MAADQSANLQLPTPIHCGSGLAREGGLPADQFLTECIQCHAGTAEGCDFLICFGFGFGFGF
jgi:hypothetical protein